MDEQIKWSNLTRHQIAGFIATGVVIPHRLYDLNDNIGYIQIVTNLDTTEFACDSIDYWWTTYGKVLYPMAFSILLLCDGGGVITLVAIFLKYCRL